MKKVLLRSRKVSENGLISEEVYITSKIARHKENRSLSLNIGWAVRTFGCVDNDGCPPAKTTGYYECIGGQCVFIPF